MNYGNSFGLISVSKMNVENLYVPVSKVVPELDGKLAKNVNFHTATGGITFNEIRKPGGKRGNLAKMFKEGSLLLLSKGAQKFENFNINEQPRVAHLESPDKPSFCSHCSGVSQRSGDLSSILAARFAA